MRDFARNRPALQVDPKMGFEWSPDDRIGLGPEAEPIGPDTWGEWADVPITLGPVVPDVAERPAGPTRRSFLGMLAIAGVGTALPPIATTAPPPAEGPMLRAYHRLQAALVETFEIEAESTQGFSHDSPEVLDQEERLGEACRRESAARRDLIAVIAQKAGYRFPCVSRLEIEGEATLATVFEGRWLFGLAVANQEGPTAEAWAEASLEERSRFVRPVAINLGDPGIERPLGLSPTAPTADRSPLGSWLRYDRHGRPADQVTVYRAADCPDPARATYSVDGRYVQVIEPAPPGAKVRPDLAWTPPPEVQGILARCRREAVTS